MWILESTGEFLKGKRVWLRPGQRYLFGRVKKDGVYRALDHKGVSRRQCVIEVSSVTPGDGSLLHTRSKIIVTDENSKGGTQVDGHRLKGAVQELAGPEHHLRLGTYPHVLTIRWLPVCLSFFLTSREKKDPDPLGPKRDLLEPLDIKAVQPFVSEQTTHVVATKRNTVPGLQALITGQYIVDHSYVDALVFATTPEDLEGDENLSPLEKDFDAAWPDPLQHLPPKGREPTSKPAGAYAPDPARENVFQGWTFVFLESGQYETILPAIITGHGKELLYKLELGKTTVEEIVTFMQNAAGGKGSLDLERSADSGGAIMVKPTLKGEFGPWADELVKNVSVKLNQHCIDQADFLDLILAGNAMSLKKEIGTQNRNKDPAHASASASTAAMKDPCDDSVAQQTPATPTDTDNQADGNGDKRKQGQSEPPDQEPPRKRPRTRVAPVSRFKTFDDEFDLYAVTPYEPIEDTLDPSNSPSAHTRATPTSLEDEQPRKNGQSRLANNGRSPPDEDATDEGFLPATAALKMRRPEMDAKRGHSAEPGSIVDTGKRKNQKARSEKTIDIRQVTRQRREAEEEAARRDREVLEGKLGDISVEDMKNVAVVEEMEVPTRNTEAERASRSASERWSECWNGRKNFKRFRRTGEAGGAVRGQIEKMIVPLVEVKRKNYGIGEAYWSSSREKEPELGDSNGHPAKLSSQIDAAPQLQIEPLTEESPPASARTRLQQDVVGAIEVDRPRRTRLADQTRQQSQQTANSSSRGKRPASSAGAGRAAAKRQKTIPMRATSESESDEDLRFKFTSRRKPAGP